MSVLDKVIAAVMPPESEQARKQARAKARAAAKSGDWLSMILGHHEQIEAAFAAVKSATTAATRMAAQKKLAIILTGHSNAEESVIYPALTTVNEKGHAGTAYTEQAAAKTQMALLDNLAPMTQDYLDKLEHIRGAVAHHVYEEEGTWFLELKERMAPTDQTKLTSRYKEEFDRYVAGEEAKI
jgi:hemerythrin superfamily protein